MSSVTLLYGAGGNSLSTYRIVKSSWPLQYVGWYCIAEGSIGTNRKNGSQIIQTLLGLAPVSVSIIYSQGKFKVALHFDEKKRNLINLNNTKFKKMIIVMFN